jgi:hypothetical protein
MAQETDDATSAEDEAIAPTAKRRPRRPRTITALDMGRQTITPRPVPTDFINKCFEIVAGALVWRERPASHFPYRAGDRAIFNARFAGHSARVRLASFVPDVLVVLASCMHRAGLHTRESAGASRRAP